MEKSYSRGRYRVRPGSVEAIVAAAAAAAAAVVVASCVYTQMLKIALK